MDEIVNFKRLSCFNIQLPRCEFFDFLSGTIQRRSCSLSPLCGNTLDVLLMPIVWERWHWKFHRPTGRVSLKADHKTARPHDDRTVWKTGQPPNAAVAF